jgi:hypothetical protein
MRADRLQTLRTGLTVGDVPFLDKCATDRSQQVRDAASTLLGLIEGTPAFEGGGNCVQFSAEIVAPGPRAPFRKFCLRLFKRNRFAPEQARMLDRKAFEERGEAALERGPRLHPFDLPDLKSDLQAGGMPLGPAEKAFLAWRNPSPSRRPPARTIVDRFDQRFSRHIETGAASHERHKIEHERKAGRGSPMRSSQLSRRRIFPGSTSLLFATTSQGARTRTADRSSITSSRRSAQPTVRRTSAQAAQSCSFRSYSPNSPLGVHPYPHRRF